MEFNKNCSIYILCPIINEAEKTLAEAEKLHKQARALEHRAMILEDRAIQMRTKYIVDLKGKLNKLEQENRDLKRQMKELQGLVNKLIETIKV